LMRWRRILGNWAGSVIKAMIFISAAPPHETRSMLWCFSACALAIDANLCSLSFT
jgi:hypothetical protein